MISIIIPVYNRQQYIEECLQSVFRSTYTNLEVVLVDDGSTDQTLQICQNLALTEPRIKVLTSEHVGVSAARNIALDAAQGDYVFFLDSDDVIHPLLLETLVTGLKNTDAGIAGTCCQGVREEYWNKVNEQLEKDFGPAQTVYKSHEETLHITFHMQSPLGMIGGVMFRRDLIGDTRFRTDLFIGEDFYFIYENLIKDAASVLLRQKWYYSRLHANNSSWDFDFSGYMNRFYRRELVWKSEEAFGRIDNANCQKKQAFGNCRACIKKHKPYSEDSKKMRKVLRQYKKELFPALSWKQKVGYYLYVYIPFSSLVI